MVNLLGPLLPLSALKPSKGTLDVPVTNCKETIQKQLSLLLFIGYTYNTVTLCKEHTTHISY